MKTMWSQGRELRIPSGAKLKFSVAGNYGGQSGAWAAVVRGGKVCGITFVAGYRPPQQERAVKSKLQFIPDIEPFQNVAVDNAVIGGRRQLRDMMREHNLVAVGNEKPQMHPRDIADQRRERADPSIVESLKRHSGGRWL